MAAQEEPSSSACPADPLFPSCLGEEEQELANNPGGAVPNDPSAGGQLRELDEFAAGGRMCGPGDIAVGTTAVDPVVAAVCAAAGGDRTYHYCGVPVAPDTGLCDSTETHTYDHNHAIPTNDGAVNYGALTAVWMRSKDAIISDYDWGPVTIYDSTACGCTADNRSRWYNLQIENQAPYYVREYGSSLY